MIHGKPNIKFSKRSYSRRYKQRHTIEANRAEDFGQDFLHVCAFFYTSLMKKIYKFQYAVGM
jgi:hypothetical protein